MSSREQQIINRKLLADISRKHSIQTLSFENINEILLKLRENGKFEDMFDCSVEWILYDETNRSGKLMELMKNIPFESLSSKFLNEVFQHKLICKNIECLKMLFDSSMSVLGTYTNKSIVKPSTSKISESRSKNEPKLEIRRDPFLFVHKDDTSGFLLEILGKMFFYFF